MHNYNRLQHSLVSFFLFFLFLCILFYFWLLCAFRSLFPPLFRYLVFVLFVLCEPYSIRLNNTIIIGKTRVMDSREVINENEPYLSFFFFSSFLLFAFVWFEMTELVFFLRLNIIIIKFMFKVYVHCVHVPIVSFNAYAFTCLLCSFSCFSYSFSY